MRTHGRFLHLVTAVAVLLVPSALMAQTIVSPASFTISPPYVYYSPSAQGLLPPPQRAQLTVTLAQPAATDVAVPLTLSRSLVGVPPTVTISAGQTSATFLIRAETWVPGMTDAAVTITAGQGTGAKTVNLQLRAWPRLLYGDLLFESPSVISGTGMTAQVGCNCVTYPVPAPNNRRYLDVTSGSPLVSFDFPEILLSETSLLFAVRTQPVAVATPVVLTVHGWGTDDVARGTIILQPAAQVASVTVSPAMVYEAGTFAGTVVLDKPTTAGGAPIKLRSSTPYVTVPAEITVAEGQTTATFTATAAGLGSASIFAQRSNGPLRPPDGPEKSAQFVMQANEVFKVTLPPTVYESRSATGTVDLNSTAAMGTIRVSLVSSNGSVVVPPEVTIGTGTSSASFPVLTTNPGEATVTARRVGGSVIKQTAVKIVPIEVTSISFSPASVIEGGWTNGLISLNGPAGSGGVNVTLAGSGVTIPAEATVLQGLEGVSFAVTTQDSGSPVVTARRSGTVAPLKTATLSVLRNEVKSLSFRAASVTEGKSQSGIVTLDGAAGASGVTVGLTSSGEHVSVPAEVTVPAGAISTLFNADTRTPGTDAIAARRSGSTVQQQAALTVLPIKVQFVTFPSKEIHRGTSLMGTVTLDGPAPSGGVTVYLRSADPELVMPREVMVSEGKSIAPFSATASETAALGTAKIEAARANAATRGVWPVAEAATTLEITK